MGYSMILVVMLSFLAYTHSEPVKFVDCGMYSCLSSLNSIKMSFNHPQVVPNLYEFLLLNSKGDILRSIDH